MYRLSEKLAVTYRFGIQIPEFWEDHFKCRYPNSTPTPYNIRFHRECTPNDQLDRDNVIFENQLQFVSDAVMALAVALHDMHRDLCGENYRGVCSKMSPTKGPDLLKYLRKVKFEGIYIDLIPNHRKFVSQ